MAREFYIFAGGGTGGHLYPGLAVAEALRAKKPEARIVFACSNRAIDRRILEATPYPYFLQPVRPLPARPWGWPAFLAAWGRSCVLARRVTLDLRPAAVLGLGGFAAAPMICRAARTGIPTALLNPDAVPGKANRALAAKADVVFTQFASSAEAFPPALRGRVRCVGCPVRAGLAGLRRVPSSRGSRREALEHFGLPEGRRTLLVFGGSLLAEALGEALERLAGGLAPLTEDWSVLHISSSPRAEQVARALAAAGLTVRTLDYCERMDLAYAAADVVLARAGAVTIAELTATGTPAVLMPYPHHADRHQFLNAAALVETGAAVICEDRLDPAANAAALREALLPLLSDPAKLDAMARAAAAAPSSAAEAVADWLAQAGHR